MASLIAVHKVDNNDGKPIMNDRGQILKNNPEYVDFSGFSEVDVVKALWNSRKFIKGSIGEIHNNDGKPLSTNCILEYLVEFTVNEKTRVSGYIDYIKGKPLKISFQCFPYINCMKYDNYKDSNWGKTTMKDVLKKLKENGSIPFIKQFEEEINNRKSILMEIKQEIDINNTNKKEEGSCVIS